MKRTPVSSVNPPSKTPHKAPVTATASSVLVRPSKEGELAAQEEVLKQREGELARFQAELERKEAELREKDVLLVRRMEAVARQEEVLKQATDDVSKREAKVTRSDLELKQKSEEVLTREIEVVRRETELVQQTALLQQQAERLRQSQVMYEETKRECDQRVVEITDAVGTLNARAEELSQQKEALTHRKAQLTAIEVQLTARGHQTIRRSLYPSTRAPEVVAVSERTSPPENWADRHSLLVKDQRAIHYSYDETQQKEVDRGMSKIDYLNRVIDEMPVDAALDNQLYIFGVILENRNIEQDPLLRAKLKIALEVIRFICVMGEYAPKPVNSGLLGMFSKAVEKSATPEELDRFEQFKQRLLRAKNPVDLDAALSSVQLSGSAVSQYSPAYHRCLSKCEEMVREFQSRCTVGLHGF